MDATRRPRAAGLGTHSRRPRTTAVIRGERAQGADVAPRRSSPKSTLLARRSSVQSGEPVARSRGPSCPCSRRRWLGRGDRTAVLRRLVPISYRTWCWHARAGQTFGPVYMGGHCAFAERWRGDGLDPELVDAAALAFLAPRGSQRSDVRTTPSTWLATEGDADRHLPHENESVRMSLAVVATLRRTCPTCNTRHTVRG